MEQGKSALIAMSGGVDSSVAALLMQQAGYQCQGVTMKLYRNGNGELCRARSCCSLRDIDDAARTAALLEIPFSVEDLTGIFRRQVVQRFVQIYEEGGTPNPCIDCNLYLKFGALLRLAEERGCSAVATGHYVRRTWDPTEGRWQLRTARDAAKDQSYVLYMLTQEMLEVLRFPLGELTKAEVREMAGQFDLPVAEKPDSQDICFVPDGDYAAFLERYTEKDYPPGELVDLNGAVIGRHRGAVRYTLGQRRGLGQSAGRRLYVCGKDMAANRVTVGPEEALYTGEVQVGAVNWIAGRPPAEPLRVTAKTRYRQTAAPAEAIPLSGGRLFLRFDQPQRAVTPGQAAVLYDGEIVLGGGTIIQ